MNQRFCHIHRRIPATIPIRVILSDRAGFRLILRAISTRRFSENWQQENCFAHLEWKPFIITMLMMLLRFLKSNHKPKHRIRREFSCCLPNALTLRFAEAMSAWFGHKPKLRFLPWDEWKKTVSETDANATWDHIAHSPNCSIEKARRLLNYTPRYSSLQAVQESIKYLIDNKLTGIPDILK